MSRREEDTVCLVLIEPTEEYRNQIMDYRQEFLEHQESMDGTSLLRRYNRIEEWLEYIRLAKSEDTCGPNWVPDQQFLCIRREDDHLVGMIDIRTKMNEECRMYYGNIGYSIRNSERKKGYATIQLALGLQICREKGMSRVLITCDRENIASARTIIKNGGSLEDEIFDPNDQTLTQRYWIELS